ncbi:hypothetical protein HQQ94_00575 [Shewanella sp. VB17]|uniref:hypothetical protein n=1 Tax=Shewanella sp. VB17 TaxID=2739432 RepID=UPI001564D5F7|nr:hypothetical protein [Shewanella sp. VB17]NRD71770.1 hypothetical protein [Shewanella sp. VB17]
MKRISLLAASIALILTGCGGSDGDDSGTKKNTGSGAITPSAYQVTAIDGYLENATVYVGEQCKTLIGKTDQQGKISIANEHKQKPVCVMAKKGETIDATRGDITKDFILKAPAGYDVVNPMTNMVMESLSADGNVSQQEAEQAVIDLLAGLGLNISEKDVFGDYLAANEEINKVLNAVGESLVDLDTAGQDVSIEDKVKFMQSLMLLIQDQLDDLEHFSPAIDFSAEGIPQVSKNNRPSMILVNAHNDLMSQFIVGGEVIQPIYVADYFEDKDGEPLTYALEGAPENLLFATDKLAGLSINEQGIISGSIDKEGDFSYRFYAIDEHGAMSYPIYFDVDVDDDNIMMKPAVSKFFLDSYNEDLSHMSTIQGEVVNERLFIGNLFTNLTQEHELSVRTDIKGLTVSLEDEFLLISGASEVFGNYPISVYAAANKLKPDSIQRVFADLSLPISQAINE